MTISKASEDQALKKHKQDIDLDLEQVFKPHNKAVTSLAVNDKGDILASGVSFDLSNWVSIRFSDVYDID